MKIIYLDEYRKKKEQRNMEDYSHLESFTEQELQGTLSPEDEQILKQIGIPMVEFGGSTITEE